MSKIEEAIYAIHHMDNQASDQYFLHKIHPLVKVFLTISYIILLTSINRYNLITTISMGLYLIIVAIVGNVSIMYCMKKFPYIFLLLLVIGIANPILDRNILFYAGVFPITTGMISMITLILKGAFGLINSYFLISTTSIEEICFALKKIHIPNMIITIIMLIYRYIIVFLKEVERIWTAYSLRAPNQRGVSIKAWGSMIGSLMLRSIDKAQVVYESMEMRGFSPDTYFVKEQTLDKKSIVCLIMGILLLFVVYRIPIFEMVGNIFI